MLELEGIPFFLQKNHFCGPSALSSVYHYYGEKISQNEIAEKIYIKELRGALISDMENHALNLGFNTKLSRGTVFDIQEEIKKRRPVIALIDAGILFMKSPHYVVIFGYDENRGLLMHTGYRQSVWMKENKFHKKWKKMGSTYLAIWKNKN